MAQAIDRVGDTAILELGPEGRFVVARNGRELLVVDGRTEEVEIRGVVSRGGESGSPAEHDHDGEYAPPHGHPYAPDDHDHPGGPGEHPDLATHTALGLAPAHDHAALADAVHEHDYADPAHAHTVYATDTDLADHAETAHGLSAHAIDGVYHSGAGVLPSAGQKNALAGTAGTPGTTNPFVTDQDARLSDARTPLTHDHALVDTDIPAEIARDVEVTAAIAAHVQAETHGSEPGTTELYAVGDLYLTTRTGNPASLLGYGTWALWGAGRFVIGADPATETAGDPVGAATHGHGFTPPADHAALSHAGATVDNHTVTQPSAHADHAAQAHSAHAGATVGNHAVTQPSAHADHSVSGAIAGEAAHTHTYTQVPNHVHRQQYNPTTTGALSGPTTAPDTSSSGTAAWGTVDTQNPTGGVAQGTTAAGSSHTHGNGTLAVSSHGAHSGTAVDAHTVGQASAHSDHAALSHGAHTGTGVDAHTVGQANQHAAQAHTGAAVVDGSNIPPGIKAFMWRRTA